VDRLKSSEAKLNAQSEGHNAKIESLKKKLAKKNEDFEVAKAKQEISEWTSSRLQKNVDELRESKERYYEKSLDCAKKLKDSFAMVGAYSSEQKFIQGNPEGVIEWISEEAEAFDEIHSDRGDFYAFAGARGVAAILEKAGCEHVKAATQAEVTLSIDHTKEPSVEATLMGGKFYSSVWMKGDREIADEVSHPVLRNKAGCISYMRQEDNIYNNRVYRDKCHNNQSIYYIAEDLLQNKSITIKRTKDRRRQCRLRNAT
jgi:hypothetical protein